VWVGLIEEDGCFDGFREVPQGAPMKTLDSLVMEFRGALRERRTGYVVACEAVLAEIVAVEDVKVIPGLLGLLDDAAEYDELMFSIVHAVERWDDRAYSRAVVDVVVKLWEDSPRWAQVVHVRILNSEKTLEAYVKDLESADERQRRTVCDIYTAIAQRWPQLASRAKGVLERLG